MQIDAPCTVVDDPFSGKNEKCGSSWTPDSLGRNRGRPLLVPLTPNYAQYVSARQFHERQKFLKPRILPQRIAFGRDFCGRHVGGVLADGFFEPGERLLLISNP